MQLIPLANTKVEGVYTHFLALDDASKLATYKWYLDHRTGYAYRLITHRDGVASPDQPAIERKYAHREVMALYTSWGQPAGKVVDHIDNNRLNCQAENLRVATMKQNGWNKAHRADRLLPKGVCYLPQVNKRNPFRAGIRVDAQKIHLGYFNSVYDAAKAYDEAADKHFGRFARPNELDYPRAAEIERRVLQEADPVMVDAEIANVLEAALDPLMDFARQADAEVVETEEVEDLFPPF
jgi:hypothetical protein